MTPALNSISPAPAGGPPKNPAPSAASEKIQPAEKFRPVMERLLAFFSAADSPAKAKADPAARPAAPDRKKDKAGNTGAAAADDGHQSFHQSKSGVAPVPGVWVPPVPYCPIPPAAAELAAVAAPEKTTTRPASASVRVARSSTESEGTSAASTVVGRKNSSATSVNGQAAPPVSGQKSMPAVTGRGDGGPVKDGVDLPQALSRAAADAPNTAAARSESQSSHAKKAPDAPPPSPEKTAGGTPSAKAASGAQDTPKAPPAIPLAGGPRSVAPSPAEPPRAHAGTAIAQQDTTMKMAAKKTNFSGAKQKLPTSVSGARAAASAAKENLPIRLPRNSAPTTIGNHVNLAPPPGAGIPSISSHVGVDPVVAAEIPELPREAATSPAYVERTRDMISLQCMHLQAADATEMRVVIQPDIGLQLSLHLQHGDGHVEVQAVLDRGNFALLNRHWPELQQQLELRGVRVAPLANADLSLGGGSAGFRHPTPSHSQQAGNDSAPDEMPVVLFPGLPPATATASASGISSRRWETWA